MEELTDKEKRFLRRVFKATYEILYELEYHSGDEIIVLDFDIGDLNHLSDKLGVDYY